MARYYQVLFNETFHRASDGSKEGTSLENCCPSSMIGRLPAPLKRSLICDLRADVAATELPAVSLKDFGEDFSFCLVSCLCSRVSNYQVARRSSPFDRAGKRPMAWPEDRPDAKVKPSFRPGDVLKLDKTRAVRLKE